MFKISGNSGYRTKACEPKERQYRMAAAPLTEKLLVGVCHHEHNVHMEKDWVLRLISQKKPRSVGLEVSPEYTRKVSWGITDGCFIDIARHIGARGIRVVALEENQQFRIRYTLELACAIAEGRYRREEISSLLGDVLSDIGCIQMSQNERAFFDYLAERYFSALQLIAAGFSKEWVRLLWRDSIVSSNEHMVEVIRAEKPDIAVIGLGHAVQIAPCLEDYVFIRSQFGDRPDPHAPLFPERRY